MAREFLLGMGGEDAEARFAGDEEFRLLVQAVERDLIDEYAAGSMEPGERSSFAGYLALHPRAAERLAFARSLVRSRTRRRLWPWAVAAAALLAGFWPAESGVLAVALTPGGLRSGGDSVQRVRLAPEHRIVRLVLATEGAVTATLRFVDSGANVWSGQVTDGSVSIPAAKLAAGDHLLTVRDSRGEEIADYTFRVEHSSGVPNGA